MTMLYKPTCGAGWARAYFGGGRSELFRGNALANPLNSTLPHVKLFS